MAAPNGLQGPHEPLPPPSSSSSAMMNGQLDFARSLADSSTPRLTGGLSATRPAPAPAAPAPAPASVADPPTAPIASTSKNPPTPPSLRQEDPLAVLLTTLSADDGESILSIAVEEARDDARDQLGHRFGTTSTSTSAGTGKRQAGRVYGGSQGGNIHVSHGGKDVSLGWLLTPRGCQVWDLATLSLRSRLTGHEGAVLALQLVPERDWLISASGPSPALSCCTFDDMLKLPPPERRRHDPSVAHADALARLPDPSTARQHRRHPLARVDPVQHARAGRSGSEQERQPPRHRSSAHREPETGGEALCWMSGHEYTGAFFMVLVA
jgi:hypothetical protein